MKKNIETRILVGVALFCALGAFGCRSGWKVGNPFSKAPKASSVETPSELDELDLTPPPENYTTSDRSKKDADKESLAQNGKYEAPEKKRTEANDSQNLVADARRDAENATSTNENFRAPDYTQDYQTAQNYNVAQNSQNAQSYRETQSYQTAPYDAPAPQNSGAISPQTVAQNPTQNGVYQQQTLNVAQNNYSNGVPNGFQNETFPSNADYSTLNVVSPNAQVATAPTNAPTTATPFPSLDSSAIAPYNTTADAATYPTTTYPAAVPTSDATRQPAYVAQNNVSNDSAYRTASVSNAPFPTSDAFLDAPENAASATQTAPTSDAYSNVYYQQQTTSGGFAPGSVGLY